MNANTQTPPWRPVSEGERYIALDTIRGVALLGVLLVNLHSDFRIPLAAYLLAPHDYPPGVDRIVGLLITALLEFKAFTVFSLLFGVGLGIFGERAAARGQNATRFLARRLGVLFLLGLCHLLLIWNGDILTLYAVCGILLLPFFRLPAAALAIFGSAAMIVPFFTSFGVPFASEETLHALAAEATRVYQSGSFGDVLLFHWHETRLMILPLLLGVLLRTTGLIALGMAVWRSGLIANPIRYRPLLIGVTVLGGLIGGIATMLSLYTISTGNPPVVSPALLDACALIPLALAYAAGGFLLLTALPPKFSYFAAVGQMALTNYLSQSVILSFLFYGYGLRLSGQLGPAVASDIGLVLYTIQLVVSPWWLRRYYFGPVEWLWRSLTYGRPQPLRRS